MEKPWYRLWPKVYPRTLQYYEGNIVDFLDATATRFSERPALIFMEKAMRFGDLCDQSRRLAAALAHMGVKRETGWPFSCPTVPSLRSPITGS